MFLVEQLLLQCKNKISDNIDMVLEKLYATTFDVDGLLLDLLKEEGRNQAINMLGSYIQQNLYQLGAAALQQATGIDLEGAWNFLQMAMANFLTGFDDAKFHLLKNSAKRTIKLLEEKSILLDKVEHEFILYYNILVALTSGDPVYDEYLDRLRRGIQELDLAQADFHQVFSELSRGMDIEKDSRSRPKVVTGAPNLPSDGTRSTGSYLKQEEPGQFLDHVYDSGKEHFEIARLLISPKVSTDYISDRISNNKVKDFFDIEDDPTFSKAGVRTIGTTVLATTVAPTLMGGAALAKEMNNPNSGLNYYATDPSRITTKGTSVDNLRARLPSEIGKATPRVVGRKAVNNVAFLARNVGLPAQDDQIANWSMLSQKAKDVVNAASGYIQLLTEINVQLGLFTGGLVNLEQTIPSFLKNHAIGRLQIIVNEIKALKEEIANNVNGDPEALYGPISDNFTPIIFVISGQANFWVAKMEIIEVMLKSFPEASMKTFQIKNDQKAAFNFAVESLQELDDLVGKDAVLSATDAREDIGSLEGLLAGFIAESHNALYTFSADQELLDDGRGIVERFSLTRQRDSQIYNILGEFMDYNARADEKMEKMAEDLAKFMENSGMSRMYMDFIKGDFVNFFGTSARGANNLAAALAIISFIIDCYSGDVEEQKKMRAIQEEIQGLQSLLNVKLNLDLDLNILRNIQDCLKLKSYAKDFDIKKFLCGLLPYDPAGGKGAPTFEDLMKNIKATLGIQSPLEQMGHMTGAPGSYLNSIKSLV